MVCQLRDWIKYNLSIHIYKCVHVTEKKQMISILCIGIDTWKKVLKDGFAPPSSPLNKQSPLLLGLRSLFFTELQPQSGPPILPSPYPMPCLLPGKHLLTWKVLPGNCQLCLFPWGICIVKRDFTHTLYRPICGRKGNLQKQVAFEMISRFPKMFRRNSKKFKSF